MAKKQNLKTGPKPVAQDKISTKKNAETKKAFPSRFRLAFLLGLISLIVYANTLKNGFVLDDVNAIQKNAYVNKGISAIPEILATPYRRGYWVTTNDYYRPLSLAVFAVEHQFFDKSPAPYHFFNILVFAGCVILVFLFLDSLFEQKKTGVAFIASLLYAVHPIHTEVVANIKSLDELLCFFFAFLSLNVFIKYMGTGKTIHLFLGSFCLLLSYLSKETVIAFLAIIPLVFFFYRNDNKKAGIYISICAVLVTVIFLCIRQSILSFYDANEIANIPFTDNPLAKADLPYESRLATSIFILGYDIRLLFVPYPLICIYSYNSIPFLHFSDPWVIASLLLGVFLIVFSIWRLVKKQKDPYAFGIIFYIIMMSLFSNILFLIPASAGERFMLFSSVGFCWVIALLIENLAAKTDVNLYIIKDKKVLGIVGAVSLIFAVMTIDRNSDWKDNYTLFSTDLKKSPNDCKLYYYVGSELEKNILDEEKDPAKKKEILAQAISYLNKSLAIYPDFREPQADLGAAYFRNGQYDSAEIHAKRALDLSPNNMDALNNLASVYGVEKKYPQAIELYKIAIKTDPEKVLPYTNTGLTYLNLGKFDSAVYYLKRAISVNPNYSSSFEILASAYHAAGISDSAKKYELIAQKNNHEFKL